MFRIKTFVFKKGESVKKDPPFDYELYDFFWRLSFEERFLS